VIGAAGAVGALLAQLAIGAGLTVDGVVSRAEHVAGARALGLGLVGTDVSTLSAGRFDAVFDTAGINPGPALREGGSYLSVSDEPLPPIPGARGIGVQEDGPALARLCRLVDSGALRLRIARRFPLRHIRQAHETFEAGGLLGKVVIDF
jgi:NADPH:quinone reductase-like Zn-dependent oxidoreductase